MTALTLAVRDSTTLWRRQLLRLRRYPSMTLLLVGLPVVLLLLFVYVFGGALGAGVPGAPGLTGRAAYLEYVTPAIVLMAAASAAQGSAIGIAMDRTEGFVARLRTMPIAPSAVLTGHVLGSVVQSFLTMSAALLCAVALGYRPGAGPADWLALAGLLLATAFALTWLAIALGLASDSVETASNLPMFLTLLPFLGSGFVPVATMPSGLRWFAEHQPFTPIGETARALLAGGPVDGGDATAALAWCVVIAAAGYAWARRLYRRER